MNRQCNRADCGEPAAASLSFDYQLRTAWLGDAMQPHSATYALCQRHADSLKVPVGWILEDLRPPSTIFSSAQAS